MALRPETKKLLDTLLPANDLTAIKCGAFIVSNRAGFSDKAVAELEDRIIETDHAKIVKGYQKLLDVIKVLVELGEDYKIDDVNKILYLIKSKAIDPIDDEG